MARVILRGRERDTTAVASVLSRVSETGHGALIVIEGVPGIGKSSFLASAVEQAQVLGFRIGASKTAEIDQIALGAPLLLALHSGPTPLVDAETFETLEPIYDKYLWLVERIAVILERIAAQTPLIVAIDDVQWADRLTRFALHTLPSRLAASPIIWALTSRLSSDDVTVIDEIVSGAEQATEVVRWTLPALAEHDIDALADDRLGVTPVNAVRDVLRSVGGNPFWALQVLDGLARRDTQSLTAEDLGAELAEGLRRKLGVVAPATVAVVELAAVWGRPLPMGDATTLLASTSRSGVLKALREAEDHGLLAISPAGITVPHDLLREVIYAEMDGRTRSELHRRCARHLGAEPGSAVAAGAHYLAVASTSGDFEAAEGLLLAAVDSANAAPEQSAQLAMEAFSRLPPEHSHWRRLGGRILTLLVEVQRENYAIQVADKLIADALDTDSAAHIQVEACLALWQSGGFSAMEQRANDALSLVGLPERTTARVAAVRALAVTRTASASAASALAATALAEGERLRDEMTQRIALLALSEAARNVGEYQNALDWLLRARSLSLGGYLAEEIRVLQHLDRYAEADTLLMTARPDAGNQADSVLPSVMFAKIWQDHNLARLDQAEIGAQLLVRISQHGGNASFDMNGRMILCAVAIYRGNLRKAREFIPPAGPEYAVDEELRISRLRATQAWLAFAEGDIQESVRILRSLLASADDGRQSWPWSPPWMQVFATAGLAANEPLVYGRALELAEMAAQRNPTVITFQAVAHQVRGLVESDANRLNQAVVLFRQAPRPLLLAGGLADLGRALFADGRAEEGRSALVEARSVYEHVGASGLAAGISPFLSTPDVHARGTKTRKVKATNGFDSLTPAELRVARLVARGHSSRSAATSLIVSTNTVNSQLRSIFNKLDVSSRVQLANILRDQDVG